MLSDIHRHPSSASADEDYCQQGYLLAYAFARHSRLQCAEAEDCASAFRLKILTDYLPACLAQSASGSATPWLRVCARNHVATWLRACISRRNRITPLAFADSVIVPGAVGDPLSILMHDEDFVLIEVAVGSLTASQQQLFALKYVRGCDANEISTITGRSIHAIEQALSAIRKRLRAVIENTRIHVRTAGLPPPRHAPSLTSF